MFSNIRKWLAEHRYFSFVIAACTIFIVFCGFAIKFEYLQAPYIVLAIIGGYILLVHTEFFFYITCLIIPFSVELREFVPSLGASISIPSEFMLIALSFLFLGKILVNNDYPKEIGKHCISGLFYFYFFWLLLTSITSTMPLVSFKFLAAKLWFIISAYFFFAQLLKKDIHKAANMLLCYAIGLAIVVGITTYKHVMLGDVRKVAYWVMSPFYNDHTAYGAILALFSPILALLPFVKALPKWQKILSIVLLFPILLGLYLSFSRAAWLSVILAIFLGVILLLKIRFRTLFCTAIIIVTIGFTFQEELLRSLSKNDSESSTTNSVVEKLQSISNISTDASNVERLNRWFSAIDMFKEKPIFGFGPGTYQFNYAPYQKPAYRTIITTNAGTGGNAHSEFLGPLSESGIMGMLIIVVLIFLVISKGLRVYKNTQSNSLKIFSLMAVLSLTSYFFHGILNNFLDTEKLAIPVFGLIAIVAICDIVYQQEKKEI